MKKPLFQIVTLALALVLVAGTLLVTGGAGRGSTAQAGTSAGSTQVSDTGTGLDVYFFQAGKADAILMTTENATVLIDCGIKGFGQTILDYLAEKGIGHIDYLIITHFDQDHVGGAAKVINNIPVYNVLQSNVPKDSTEYEKYIKALNNAGIEAVTVSETMEFVLDGVLFSVDPPHSASYSSDASNNSSLIVSVYNGENSFLFTGDAQTERIEEFLEAGHGTYDFLKVPHHGGEDDLMEALIASVSPAYAVITSSDQETEASSTVEVLSKYGVETYLTRLGPILVHSDGTSITVTQG